MGEYIFGVRTATTRLPAAEVKRRDRICCEEGGTGYVQIKEPTGQWKGWFTGPNLGCPFDRDLAHRVMARVLPDVWT